MSEISHEKGCGKATMYVITEKGLDIGPFAYGKKTDSRVLCTNTGHIYYSQKGNENEGSQSGNSGFGRDLERRRRLKVVEIGTSLQEENHVDLPVRNRDNWGRTIGKFSAGSLLQKSGETRQEKHDKTPEKKQSQSHLIQQILHVSERKDSSKTNGMIEDKMDHRQSLNGTRQSQLRRLQVKRQCEELNEELTKLRGKSLDISKQFGDDKETRKRDSFLLKQVFYPGKKKSDFHCRSSTNLPSLKRSSNSTSFSEKESKGCSVNSQENIPVKTDDKDGKKLVFINSRTEYSSAKEEDSAKMNINACKLNTTNPKLRFPVVIDQRTGEMHSVPGVIAYRKCDYNRWSRKQHYARRHISPSRSPLVTYASVFPCVFKRKGDS